MNLLISPPMLATIIDTHLYKYRSNVGNQTSLITGLKIPIKNSIRANGYVNTHEED